MQNNFNVAHKHFKNAIEIAKKKQNKQAIADSYNQYGIFLMEINETTQAIQYFEKSVELN